MLKSIVREIIGASGRQSALPQCLKQFVGLKPVLLIFADAEDDRAAIEDDLLRSAHMRLIEADVEVFNVAGGGVFPLFEGAYDLDADDIREKLEGPQPGEFAIILIGRDGTVKLRSREPLSPEEIFTALDRMPRQAC